MARDTTPAMLLALLVAQLALAAAAPAAAPTAAAASMPTASFAASAHAVRQGGRWQVTDYKLEGDATASTLQLTRFEVFSPNALVGAPAGRMGSWQRDGRAGLGTCACRLYLVNA